MYLLFIEDEIDLLDSKRLGKRREDYVFWRVTSATAELPIEHAQPSVDFVHRTLCQSPIFTVFYGPDSSVINHYREGEKSGREPAWKILGDCIWVFIVCWEMMAIW